MRQRFATEPNSPASQIKARALAGILASSLFTSACPALVLADELHTSAGGRRTSAPVAGLGKIETNATPEISHTNKVANESSKSNSSGTGSASASSQSGSSHSDSNPAKVPFLVGTVRHDVCPFKEDGSTEIIPQGTKLSLNLNVNLNSELAMAGDEIWAEVATDLHDEKGSKVVLPGKWRVKGHVTRVESVKRFGRDGYVEVKFDQLVSPDGKWTVPLDARASTKESMSKTVAKQVAVTSGYTGVGAIGGALASVQIGGIGTAIATYGISVGVGAAAGATLGLVAAARRRGNIQSNLAGEEIEINLPTPIVVPAFKQEAIPSKAPKPVLKDVDFIVKEFKFGGHPFGDKKSRLLTVRFLVENHSSKPYTFADLAVKDNHNHNSFVDILSNNLAQAHKKVAPNAVQEATLTFQVTSDKLKYWLVLLDRDHANILSQVAIN